MIPENFSNAFQIGYMKTNTGDYFWHLLQTCQTSKMEWNFVPPGVFRVYKMRKLVRNVLIDIQSERLHQKAVVSRSTPNFASNIKLP